MLGSVSVWVGHVLVALPAYPYLLTDYATVLSVFTHHQWIGGISVLESETLFLEPLLFRTVYIVHLELAIEGTEAVYACIARVHLTPLPVWLTPLLFTL